MAFTKTAFYSTVRDTPTYGEPDDELFDSWIQSEAKEMKRALGGEEASTGACLAVCPCQREYGARARLSLARVSCVCHGHVTTTPPPPPSSSSRYRLAGAGGWRGHDGGADGGALGASGHDGSRLHRCL